MSASARDVFVGFAEESRLRITTEPLYSAPRDVLQAPQDVELCFLVTLCGTTREERSVRLAYFAPLSNPSPPGPREVLWWLAADSWALEEAKGNIADWAAGYGYELDSATEQLFQIHTRQAAALRELLGPENCQRLLALYATEASLSR
jgi:hypothetical protein